ncbi:MAG: biotin--[acetyl-CoA-carboxylase] ligase [Candidatus Aminicenantes bacterium]|jgi:BirA family biotin operon repressor/biotin-[acetyl-CoA-carboxylase] ligase
MDIGAKIVRVESCQSTNDLAKDLAQSGEAEGTVVISEEQTQGKGTKGRSWFSARKKGLYLSVILNPPSPEISLLPLVAGLAVSDAVFSTVGIRIGLKWPNDLVWEGKKLGGLLCESGYLGNRVNYVILGLGLNLSHEKDDFPEEIRQQAVSLKLITKEDTDEKALLENLWQALNRWYGLFLQGKREKIINAFQERSAFPLGSEVTLALDGEEISGIYKGINSQGGLVLEREGVEKTFFSAEIKTVKESQKEG